MTYRIRLSHSDLVVVGPGHTVEVQGPVLLLPPARETPVGVPPGQFQDSQRLAPGDARAFLQSELQGKLMDPDQD